jgi:integrase
MASINRRTIRWTTKTGESRSTEKYEALYQDRAGKRHRRLFVLKKDARRWLDEQTAGMVTGQWADPRAGKKTVRAYGEAWLARQVISPGTVTAYRTVLTNHVYPALGAMRMDTINRTDVQKLVKSWETSAAARTVEGRYAVLAILMRAAVKDRVISTSPCVDIKLPKIEPRSALVPISTATVLALREALPPRYRAFITVAAGTGMRRGELLGLTLDRVAFDFATIRVDRQLGRTSRSDAVTFGPPKTAASTRTVPVAQVVLDAIREHVDTFGHHESGVIFTTEIGSPLTTSTLHAAWRQAAHQVGTDATPHSLRHYFASVQIRAGQSIKVLQALLGHKSAVETWDTYGHLMGDEDERTRSAIEEELGNIADYLRTSRGP